MANSIGLTYTVKEFLTMLLSAPPSRSLPNPGLLPLHHNIYG
jgi:hypothetical protein